MEIEFGSLFDLLMNKNRRYAEFSPKIWAVFLQRYKRKTNRWIFPKFGYIIRNIWTNILNSGDRIPINRAR